MYLKIGYNLIIAEALEAVNALRRDAGLWPAGVDEHLQYIATAWALIGQLPEVPHIEHIPLRMYIPRPGRNGEHTVYKSVRRLWATPDRPLSIAEIMERLSPEDKKLFALPYVPQMGAAAVIGSERTTFVAILALARREEAA